LLANVGKGRRAAVWFHGTAMGNTYAYHTAPEKERLISFAGALRSDQMQCAGRVRQPELSPM